MATNIIAPPEGFELEEEIKPPEGFEIEEPKSFIGLSKNLGTDIKEMGSGIAGLGKGLLQAPIETTKAFATNIGPSLFNEAKRIGLGELATGHPINAIEKFGEAAYQKPLTTTLDVLPAVGAAGKALGIGGKVARGAEMASEAGNIAEDVARAGAVEKGILGAASKAGETLKGAVKGPLEEVGDFLTQKYKNVATKPGFGQTAGSYLKEHAQNMALKTLGAAPGQVRKLGVGPARELGELAIKKGIVSPAVGSQGAEKMINAFADTAGKTIGGIRKIATQRGALHDVEQLTNQIKTKLDPIYTQGLKSGEKGTYFKALSELKRTPNTPEAVAKKITELFQEARGLDRLKKPSGAVADVARELRNANEGLLRKYLGPKEIDAYDSALDEYGAMTQMKEFVKRRGSMEAGGRLGPGAGLSRMMIQKFFDSIGYKAEARIANKLADWVQKNPEAASSPTKLFNKYIDEAVEAIDEMGENIP